jgi:hypothetical protein
MIHRVQACGDTIYIEAPDQPAALKILTQNCGHIPSSMLKWDTVDALPEGEELLPDTFL